MELPRQGEGNDLQILKFGIPNLRVPPQWASGAIVTFLVFQILLEEIGLVVLWRTHCTESNTRTQNPCASSPSIIPTNEKGGNERERT